MHVTQILKESFVLLRKEPKLFIPRFITTALYSVVLLYTAQLTAQMAEATGLYSGVSATPDPEVITSLLGGAFILLFSVIILLLVDLFSYAMYPILIRDYYKGAKTNLAKSFKEAFGAWKMILVLWVLIMIFSTFLGLLLTVFQTLTIETGDSIYYLMALGAVLLAVLFLLIALFFVMPSAAIEKKGIIHTFREGFNLSMKYKTDVIVINIFFIALTLLTLGIITYSEIKFSEGLAIMAGLIFILTRIFEAVIYTYISVVNPYFYMKVAE
jgi:hypothetical protein